MNRGTKVPASLLKRYLQEAKVMQLATVRSGRPWVCSVYFVAEGKSLYWLSWPSRRHSRDIASDSQVAVAIAVKTDRPVIGIQAEGKAEQVASKEEVRRVMDKYVAKYNEGKKFYENFISGKNQHEMYRFTPENIVLFDEVNFEGAQARQELHGEVTV